MDAGLQLQDEQTLVYSMVACGDVVLAEYCPLSCMSSGDAACSFKKAAAQFFPNLQLQVVVDVHNIHLPPPQYTSDSNNMLSSFTCHPHTFHFLTQDDFIFLVVSNGANGEQIAPICLQHIKADFYKCYKEETTSNANFEAHNFDNKDFGSILKEHMQYFMDRSQKLVRFASIKDQIKEAKDNAMEDIQKVHDVESQTTIEIRTLSLQEIESFHRQGKKLKRQMWIHQTKVRVVAALISIVIMFSIWLIVCRGFEC